VLRTVQAFPSAPSAQMKLCEGLEEILALVDEKLSILKSGMSLRKKEQKRIDFLAEVLNNVVCGSPMGVTALFPLATELISDARQGMALRFLQASPEHPARFVAAHSLTVAQVVCRLLLHDQEWQGRLEEPLLVAMLHDVGMLRVPAEILTQGDALNDDQRRIVERHPVLGAEIAGRLWPGGGWPVEAIADHHERIDGTGYPSGRGDQHLSPFSRLLAVCDVYAALGSNRPYRQALDSRTALTDTLLLADQGALDRFQAERLLTLSFYPVGSVVEVSDGSVGVVVAVNPCQKGNPHPAKPVVALLTDPHGLPLAIPRHLDLSQDENRSVLRNLPNEERRHLLLKRYPALT
jgi:HD-GYP domain-containing protein (c-di-GMP phosphodiesterase class II)